MNETNDMAEELELFTADDIDDFALRASAPAGIIDDLYFYGVAVQGGVEIRGADQDVLVAAFYDHEAHS